MARNALFVAHHAAPGTALQSRLKEQGFHVSGAPTVADAAQFLEHDSPDVVVMDMEPSAADGLSLLERALHGKPSAVVAVAPSMTEATVRDAHRMNASRIVPRDASPAELEDAIGEALAPHTFAAHLLQAHREGVYDRADSWQLVGLSEAIRNIHRKVGLAARAGREPVLIEGVPGSENRSIGRAIHAKTSDATGPRLRVTCGKYTEAKLDIDLFGAERSASLGIPHPRAGLLEAAESGSLVLDRVCALPLSLQTKLLRAMESGLYRRVGGTQVLPLQARIIAVAVYDLKALVAQGTFRADLYDHLSRFSIAVPPLSKRPEDILPLAAYLFRKFAQDAGLPFLGFEQATMAGLRDYPWPGNVHELFHRLQAALYTAHAPLLQAAALGMDHPSSDQALDEVEREHIVRMLDRHGWKKAKVARLLGINRTTLWHKINRYELEEGRG